MSRLNKEEIAKQRAPGSPRYPSNAMMMVKLLTVALDVRLGGDRWVLTGLDRVLLSGEPKGVIPLRVEDVITLMALVTRDDVARDISKRVSDM